MTHTSLSTLSPYAPTELEEPPLGYLAPLSSAQTMLAHVLVEPGRIEFREVPKPRPEPGGVVVRVRTALTCGTDLKAFLRGHPKFPMPTLFGHEFSGEIAEVGPGVTRFREGDMVMSTHSAPCGDCYYCRRDQGNLCDTIMSTMVLGAYAEYIKIPERIVRQNMFHKPADVDFLEAALLEPLACVLHGFEKKSVWYPEDTVVIIGSGAIGLLFLVALKAYGVQNVIVAGRRPFRLQMAQTLGASHVIDVSTMETEEAVLELTKGRGADAVIECTGKPEVWESAVRMTRRGGDVILFGGCKKGTTVTFDTHRIHYDQITLHSPFHMTPLSVRKAYDLITDHQIPGRKLITGQYKLEQLCEVFDLLQNSDCIKCAVIP
ncbi:MAG: alcohol dehydrogenase catalytic domain-containing protein [Blastocatellia bacterium]|nr:alcohol dehydrogenase catalytic domain-containing protein [Blastocatellia bacterium]